MRWLTPALMLILTFAPGGGVAAETETPAELTTAAAVRMLPAEQAAQARPVRLRGQLLLTTTLVNALVLFDGVEGIYVALNRPVDPGWRLGDELEVAGTTEAGDFAPIVRATRVRRLGRGELPPARAVSIAELHAGGFDAAWVELRGIVRSCRPAPAPLTRPVAARPRGKEGEAPATTGGGRENWLLVLAQGDNRMTVQVNDRVSAEGLVDAEVRVRAVVFNVHNANRQFVRATLQAANAAMVEVLVPPPENPFALPPQRIGELLRFTREGFTGHRVHVRGIVTAHEDGLSFWVRDGDRGLRIASTQPDRLRPGDEVDILGFPDHGSYTPSLSDAVFRRTGSGPPPAPQPLRATEDISRHDSNLVQLYAELREVRVTPEGQQLLLAWGRQLVSARLIQSADEDTLAGWRIGSQVRVAGICLVSQPDLRSTGLWLPEDLRLLLRTPQDVAVMRAAPWLTTQRALRLVVIGLLLTLAALIVVALAARRQITQREEARKLAEVEFAAMLAERNRLAREIHDTVAQDLNAVSMQLELARNAAAIREAGELVPFLTTAHQLVRKCLAEARESIWNMRSHILERTDLAGALRSVAEQLAAGQPCRIRTEVRGRSRRLSPMIENNLLRIGQEAVANALKHASPGTIEITLDFQDEEVRLVVRDDGKGFDPASAVESAGTHFGLRGMRERAAQMGGEFRLECDPAGGMRVTVTIRVRASAPV